MKSEIVSLSDTAVAKLEQRIGEITRASRGSQTEYVDLANSRITIVAKQHTVVFGRRGSGKTMLLNELEKNLKHPRQRSVWVDIDDYKHLSYPDVLIQVLREVIRQLGSWLASELTWIKPWPLSGRRRNLKQVGEQLSATADVLDHLLKRFEESDVKVEETTSKQSEQSAQAGVRAGTPDVGVGVSGRARSAQAVERKESTTMRERKIDRIQRMLQDLKLLIGGALQASGHECFLVLDDFYHLKFEDQAKILDYLQSLCKNVDMYVKFSTIEHRTCIYKKGEVIEGMQMAHDVLPIKLDRTFQDFRAVSDFLNRVLQKVSSDVGEVDQNSPIFGGHSWRQLVLSSGGVPRDFLNVLTKSIQIARERDELKLDLRTVNEAANLYLRETKRQDLQLDSEGQTDALERILKDIRDFCVEEKRKNVFLIAKDELENCPAVAEYIKQLTDFRLIHQVHENISASGRRGRFEAYMLDAGLYAHPQRRGERRVVEVEFWEKDDSSRMDQIRNSPDYKLKTDYSTTMGSPYDEPELDVDAQASRDEESQDVSQQLDLL